MMNQVKSDIVMSPNVMKFIYDSVRELEKEVAAKCNLMIEIRIHIAGTVRSGLSPQAVLRTVAQVLEVEALDISSKSRKASLNDARCIIAKTMILMGSDLVGIARLLNRDRTSVYNMLDRYSNLIQTRDPEFIRKAEKVQEELGVFLEYSLLHPNP